MRFPAYGSVFVFFEVFVFRQSMERHRWDDELQADSRCRLQLHRVYDLVTPAEEKKRPNEVV